jgi:uncharacterized coiled-coil protein SlyX
MRLRTRVVYMPKNRVEELEATVAELESTVRGLTEELVETKERVRILEAELDADPQSVVADVETNVDLGDDESQAQSAARSIPESETTQTEIVTAGEDETPEAGPEDVEAATKAATEDPVEEAKTTEGETADDSEESDASDDIIVA